MEISLAQLAQELGARLVGDGDRKVAGVATLDTAGPGQISFFANKKYKAQFLATKAGAVIVGSEQAAGETPPGTPLLVVDPAYLAFARASTRFHEQPAYPAGVDPRAAVDPSAQIDPTATILPFAYVGRGVRIGARTVVHAHCAILDGAQIGEDSLLYPGVVVREQCVLGARTIVQPGAVIGADGFGFAFDPENFRHFKVPQAGRVRIADDVEIGANTCIDRGTLGDTTIGQGAKIDDLVMIAHNVEVGPLCLFAAQTGIAGSAKLGMAVMTGGQTGIIGHLNIGDGVKLSAQSLVIEDLEGGSAVGGTPAIDQTRWLRETASVHHLPELLKEVRKLKKRLEELEGRAI